MVYVTEGSYEKGGAHFRGIEVPLAISFTVCEFGTLDHQGSATV